MNSTSLEAADLFEILVRENSPMLLAYIRSSIRDSAAADDIWQETMLVAWRRLSEFDRSRPFGPWLRGIASRLILNHFRKRTPMVQVDESTLDFLDAKFDEMQTLRGDTFDEKLQALRDCVSALPDHYRICIEMRFIEGVKPTELSERIDLALESVKKRLVRAKGMLMQCIDQKLTIESSAT